MHGSRKPNPTRAVAANTISDAILTVQEVAALLKVPPSSIYEWTRFRGTNRSTPLPHRKVGKYLRFLRAEVDAWLVGLPQAANSRKRKYTRKEQQDGAEASPVSAKPRRRAA
jgi:excisionase family DNA binding protein